MHTPSEDLNDANDRVGSQKPLEIVQHSTDMMNLATMNTREDEHADYIS
jgi:hypothetical protein